jgi:hypothetical protein
LKAAAEQDERIVFVHYSCGNFYDSPDQPTPIVCIALVESGTSKQEKSFSVIDSPHEVGLEERERSLLARFYDEMRARPDARVIHWNMNSSAFGFAALGLRYRYLTGNDAPNVPAADRRFDLDDIIAERFGPLYAAHPKLRQLCILNSLFMPHFMLGQDEAAAVARREFGPVVNSTNEKVRLISNIFHLLRGGKLKTLNSVGWVSFAGEQVDAVSAVLAVAERINSVYAELAHRHDNRSTVAFNDEYDAQDLFRALLRIFFDDIRAEDPGPQVAGASSRVDFVLPEVGLAVELKFTRTSMTTKALGEELIIDKTRYAGHGKITHLVFLVFDRSRLILNPRGIESDLSREKSEEEFAVTVRILQ